MSLGIGRGVPTSSGGVRVGRQVLAGVDQGRAPFVVDALEQAEVLAAAVDEVPVILNGNDHAELSAVLGAFAQGIREIGFDGVAWGIVGGLLAVPEGRL